MIENSASWFTSAPGQAEDRIRHRVISPSIGIPCAVSAEERHDMILPAIFNGADVAAAVEIGQTFVSSQGPLQVWPRRLQ
jgi:hypothetical protein